MSTSIPEPPALSRGTSGAARIPHGPRLGVLTAWRVVLSPTTGQYTLIAEGRFARYYARDIAPLRAEAALTPESPPARIGRPKPPRLTPFRFAGRVALLTPSLLTIAEGEVLPA